MTKIFVLETMDGKVEYKTEEFGHDITFNGVTYRLTQEAYISNNTSDYYDMDEELYYTAEAVSEKGELARIVWKAREDWKEIEDEQEICDWDNPAKVELI